MSLYTVFTTAFHSACASMEVEENTVLREKVWAAMNGDASPAIPAAPSTPPRLARHTAEPPGAPARPVREMEVEEVAESVSKLSLGDDEKLTPVQKVEKQLAATQSKLDTLRARQGTKKQTAKQKEKDPEEIAKLEAKIPELQTKLEKEKLKEEKKSGGGKKTAKDEKEPKPKENFPKWTPSAKNLTLANAERVGTTVDDAV
jgi:TolA-binding protein